jgi:glutamate racemase
LDRGKPNDIIPRQNAPDDDRHGLKTQEKWMKKTSDASILVTDSGLGGLSVFNRIAACLADNSPWPGVDLTYFNAWPAPMRGYNHFDTLERRVRVFDNALRAMDRFDPDQILIACNTLSVIYPFTPFAKETKKEVREIVSHGVQMLFEHLTRDPSSVAVVFGTPSTVQAASHEKGLRALGISKERILSIGCTNLAGYIEREPFSDIVGRTIDQCVGEAVRQLDGTSGPVHAALCCTHFGYRQTLFRQAFDQHTRLPVTLSNPNIRMANQVFEPQGKHKFERPDIRVRIVSQAVWEKEQIAAFLKLMPDMTRAVREALLNYEQTDTLFSVA